MSRTRGHRNCPRARCPVCSLSPRNAARVKRDALGSDARSEQCRISTQSLDCDCAECEADFRQWESAQ